MTLRVGLTGGLGAGKSTVARRLAERGLPVLDADRIVHALYEPGGKGAAAIAETFGAHLLDARGAVDRKRLATRVFGDADTVARLNALIHPLVHDAQAEWFRALDARGEPLGVVEATLLLESGGRARYDVIVTVSAPVETRLDRALARTPGTDREALRKRIAAQMSDVDRERLADVVLVNDGPPDALLAATDTLAERLRALSAKTDRAPSA